MVGVGRKMVMKERKHKLKNVTQRVRLASPNAMLSLLDVLSC